jgi:cbb3-type cytochrome oxidase subunit 3
MTVTVIFILILVLIIFLFGINYFYQKEQRKNMPDESNWIEPKGKFIDEEDDTI